MKVVIDGAGEIGSHLAKLLVREGNDVAVIDSERSRLDNLCASVDIEPVEGEPTSLKSLIDAQAGKADLFIAVVPYVDRFSLRTWARRRWWPESKTWTCCRRAVAR